MTAESTETHELTVSGAPDLRIRNAVGTVTLTAGADGQVRLVATKTVRGLLSGLLSGGEDELEQVRIHVRQQGDAITVDVEYPHRSSFKGYRVDLAFTVPASANVESRLAAGNFGVEGITGTIRTEVNAGNVELRGTRGLVDAEVNAGNAELTGVELHDASRLEMNAGNVRLDGTLASGASLAARVNTGNVLLWLPRAMAVQLEARTQAGNVSIEGFPVSVTRGLVQQSASGATRPGATSALTARVDTGNVTIAAK